MTVKQCIRFPFALTGSMIFLSLAIADSATPPADFWYYMAEYADDSAAVFDPSDFAVVTSAPRDITKESQQLLQEISETTPQKADDGDAVEKRP